MDFTKILELLKDNTEAVEFIKGVQSKDTELTEKLTNALNDADKYKDEAKTAFSKRDSIVNELSGLKEQLETLKSKQPNTGDPDKELLDEIEKLKDSKKELEGQILSSEKDGLLGKALAGMEFKATSKEAEAMIKDLVKNELSKGLVKNDELGWVYADKDGKPQRDLTDPTKFLTPETYKETKRMKEFLTSLTGIGSTGDGYDGSGNGGGENKPLSYKEKQKAFLDQ